MSETPKVVILCGGKGTRSYPFTEYFPKVMMPIEGTPIIVHVMRIYAAQGFKEFVLAAGYRREVLIDYFTDRSYDFNVEIVDTGDESDTGERIFRCKDHVGDRFLATYGDGLGNVDLQNLVETHERNGALATLTAVPLRSQYGHVEMDEEDRVIRFDEKPEIKEHWINAGFFAFERKAFDLWNGGQNLEQDVLPAIAAKGGLFTYRHHGFWKSMDTSKDQAELMRIHEEEGPIWMDLPNGRGR